MKRAKRCHEAGIDVIAIGFGGADEEFLRKIASTDTASIFTDLENLVDTFSNIAQVLTEQGEFRALGTPVKRGLAVSNRG